MIIRVPRSTSFWLLSCMSTILLPLTWPRRIITAVDIMLSMSLEAVPDFILVEPVTNSGPTTATIGISQISAAFAPSLQVMHEVSMPALRAPLMAPKIYGAPPEALMPTSVSDGVGLKASRSFQPRSASSSAPSTAVRMAVSPPAIIPMNFPLTPYVGRISDASTIPRRPEVPAPM